MAKYWQLEVDFDLEGVLQTGTEEDVYEVRRVLDTDEVEVERDRRIDSYSGSFYLRIPATDPTTPPPMPNLPFGTAQTWALVERE